MAVLIGEQNIYSPESWTIPELQMHPVANSSHKAEAIGARKRWSDSSHYSEENKATNTPAVSPSLPCPHLSKLIQMDKPREMLRGTALHWAAGAVL